MPQSFHCSKYFTSYRWWFLAVSQYSGFTLQTQSRSAFSKVRVILRVAVATFWRPCRSSFPVLSVHVARAEPVSWSVQRSLRLFIPQTIQKYRSRYCKECACLGWISAQRTCLCSYVPLLSQFSLVFHWDREWQGIWEPNACFWNDVRVRLDIFFVGVFPAHGTLEHIRFSRSHTSTFLRKSCLRCAFRINILLSTFDKISGIGGVATPGVIVSSLLHCPSHWPVQHRLATRAMYSATIHKSKKYKKVTGQLSRLVNLHQVSPSLSYHIFWPSAYSHGEYRGSLVK